MYKLLIVDDEYLVRTGIRETIEWSGYDIEIAGEASNGLKALELARELKPDIIISDVRMPVMDGLELSKHLTAEEFDGIVIIISGYSDFDYAKKAIDAGVTSYILKPVDNDELLHCVLAARDKLKTLRKNSRAVNSFNAQMPFLRKGFLKEFLSGAAGENDVNDVYEKLTLFSLTPIEKGIVVFAKTDDVFLDAGKSTDALNILCRLIDEPLHKYEVFTEVFDGYMTVVTGFSDGEFLAKQLETVLRKYEKQCGEVVSIGISDVYDGFLNVPEALSQAKTRAENKLFPTINTVVSSGNSQSYKKTVLDAMSYITKNYSKNLSIKSVAEDLYVSESHLMHIFKENLNKTFVECLTDFRVLKAKELLRAGKHRINEIAYLVGYGDVKHFGQIFKKQTEMTPSEFIASEKSR